MKNRIVCLALAFVLLLTAAPAALAAVPEALNVDWDARHTWEELEGILQTEINGRGMASAICRSLTE